MTDHVGRCCRIGKCRQVEPRYVVRAFDEASRTEETGPRGTIKMLVDGSGQIKMTKVSSDARLERVSGIIS